MTPKPGPRIEITPETRLGDLLGRWVCWRHESGHGWQRGFVTAITGDQVKVLSTHGLSFALGWEEIYEANAQISGVIPHAESDC